LSYNPFTQVYSLNDDVSVNYMIAVRKWFKTWVIYRVLTRVSSLI
jgi:hypothetical protein